MNCSTRCPPGSPRIGPGVIRHIASLLGSVVWLEGNFAAAREHLLRALADRSAADPQVLDTAWWVNVDPISSAHTLPGADPHVEGDLDDANSGH